MGRLHEIGAARSESGYGNESGLGAHFIAAEQLQAIEFVCGDYSFIFIELSL